MPQRAELCKAKRVKLNCSVAVRRQVKALSLLKCTSMKVNAQWNKQKKPTFILCQEISSQNHNAEIKECSFHLNTVNVNFSTWLSDRKSSSNEHIKQISSQHSREENGIMILNKVNKLQANPDIRIASHLLQLVHLSSGENAKWAEHRRQCRFTKKALAVRNQLIKVAPLAVYWVLPEHMQNYFGYSSVTNNLYSINQLKYTRWSNGLTRFFNKIFKP